jgi:hypothetical protein
MSHLETLRVQLDRIIADAARDLDARAAARQRELDAREAELARAIELATIDAAVQAAWDQCRREERLWFKKLIRFQLDALSPTSGTRTVLHTLDRMVEEG